MSNMIHWLEDQYKVIEKHDDYHEESYNLYNRDIPLARLFFMESLQYVTIILIVQGINSIMVVASIGADLPYILYVVASFGNAAVMLLPRKLYKRRYMVEGMCRGVQVLVDAINIQNDNEREKI